MHKNLYTLALAILFTLPHTSIAQCKPEECIGKISNGFTFLKTYKIEQQVAGSESSYVFSKDTNYMLFICNQEGNSKNIIVTVYDSNKKEVATNYDKKNDKFFSAFIYNCKVTGIYYMKFTFTDQITCCNGILAFKK